MHRGKSARAGAAQQTQQECFRLIVACMAERNRIRPEFEARAFEKLVPRQVPRVFNRATSAGGERAHVGALRDEWPAERGRNPRRETLIGFGIVA